jgi:enamine deaminase RidA (YjgF/YER057c/UK114 family)
MSSDNVVSVQVYLTDAATFERMNIIYRAYFKEPRPTRTTVVVAKPVGQGHKEITTTARKQKPQFPKTVAATARQFGAPG